MKRRLLPAGVLLAIALSLPMVVLSLDVEDAHTAGCLPLDAAGTSSSACVACHKNAKKIFPANPSRTCTTYCMSCHSKSDMERHHNVGTELPMASEADLYVTDENKMVCSTCHDLSKPRYDSVRWKAASLFNRMFNDESRYKTYFLSMRNDQGQLCLTCH